MNEKLISVLNCIIDDNIDAFQHQYQKFDVKHWTSQSRNTLILQAVDLHRTNFLQLILQDCETTERLGLPIKTAAREGADKCLELLLPFLSNTYGIFDDALLCAVQSGHDQCLHLLLPHVHFSRQAIGEAIVTASALGYSKCLNMLIPLAQSNFDFDGVLRSSASRSHTECVRLLLEVSDPKTSNSSPLRWASINQNQEMFDLLYPLSDPYKALQAMKQSVTSDEEVMMLEQRIKSDEERAEIQQRVQRLGSLSSTRKM